MIPTTVPQKPGALAGPTTVFSVPCHHPCHHAPASILISQPAIVTAAPPPVAAAATAPNTVVTRTVHTYPGSAPCPRNVCCIRRVCCCRCCCKACNKCQHHCSRPRHCACQTRACSASHSKCDRQCDCCAHCPKKTQQSHCCKTQCCKKSSNLRKEDETKAPQSGQALPVPRAELCLRIVAGDKEQRSNSTRVRPFAPSGPVKSESQTQTTEAPPTFQVPAFQDPSFHSQENRPSTIQAPPTTSTPPTPPTPPTLAGNEPAQESIAMALPAPQVIHVTCCCSQMKERKSISSASSKCGTELQKACINCGYTNNSFNTQSIFEWERLQPRSPHPDSRAPTGHFGAPPSEKASSKSSIAGSVARSRPSVPHVTLSSVRTPQSTYQPSTRGSLISLAHSFCSRQTEFESDSRAFMSNFQTLIITVHSLKELWLPAELTKVPQKLTVIVRHAGLELETDEISTPVSNPAIPIGSTLFFPLGKFRTTRFLLARKKPSAAKGDLDIEAIGIAKIDLQRLVQQQVLSSTERSSHRSRDKGTDSVPGICSGSHNGAVEPLNYLKQDVDIFSLQRTKIGTAVVSFQFVANALVKPTRLTTVHE